MSTPARLLGFVVLLGGVLLAALGVGRAVGPLDTDDEPAHGHEAAGADGHDHAGTVPAGLSVSAEGYTLRLASPTHPRDRAAELAFTVVGPDGEPVTAFTTTHEKDLHLIVVRRDGTGFQHLHPALLDDGTWTTGLRLAEAGDYKLFADFVPAGGPALTLAADLAVPGPYAPAAWPEPRRSARVGGYTVEVDGDLAPGAHGTLTFTVSRDGEPVDRLEPHLGARGHLVVLRQGDLAYLHAHPDGDADPRGGSVSFDVDVPTPGAYRLYLDFQHDGVVRTAAFVLHAGDVGPAPAGHGHEDGHDHEH